VGVDCHARAAALATRFIPFREGGEWHPAETIAVAAIALAALAFSVYIVYLLEIVKLANPRIRARRQQERATTVPARNRATQRLKSLWHSVTSSSRRDPARLQAPLGRRDASSFRAR